MDKVWIVERGNTWDPDTKNVAFVSPSFMSAEAHAKSLAQKMGVQDVFASKFSWHGKDGDYVSLYEIPVTP